MARKPPHSKTPASPKALPDNRPVPFSRRIALTDIPDRGLERTIEADEAERERLARDLDLPAIAKLVAIVKMMPKGRRIDLTGRVDALVTQTCVVSLEPFPATVSEPIEISFAEDPELAGPGRDGELPDPVEGGVIDIGAVTAEFLVLGLDPHPRKPGVTFDAEKAGAAEKLSPFDALKGYRPTE